MKEKLTSNLKINKVALATGLSPHVIRIWERRYKAVSPTRSDTNRRFYTEEDIERLHWLKKLTDEGHRIGQVAQLPLGELRELCRIVNKQSKVESFVVQPSELMRPTLQAVADLDAHALELCLAQASLTLAPLQVVKSFLIPLWEELAEARRAGRLRMMHGQFAAALIRPFLMHSIRSHEIASHAPVLVAATPAGGHYEFDSLCVMAVAAALNLRPTFLGMGLPPEEIAAGATQLKAKVVAISIVNPHHDPLLHKDLQRLRKLLPESMTLLASGAALPFYEKTLSKLKALQAHNIDDVKIFLEKL